MCQAECYGDGGGEREGGGSGGGAGKEDVGELENGAGEEQSVGWWRVLGEAG